jgi:hypothetical protein
VLLLLGNIQWKKDDMMALFGGFYLLATWTCLVDVRSG